MSEEGEVDGLTDAIIEDTVHCDFCGTSWVLGGYGDGICIQSPKPLEAQVHEGFPSQLKLCMDCAAEVARAYDAEAKQSDRCEHGVLTGDWCQPCHAEYRRAREENGDSL